MTTSLEHITKGSIVHFVSKPEAIGVVLVPGKSFVLVWWSDLVGEDAEIYCADDYEFDEDIAIIHIE